MRQSRIFCTPLEYSRTSGSKDVDNILRFWERFFVDISESIHPIFTGQANEITNFSTSIGTNFDKTGQNISKNGP